MSKSSIGMICPVASSPTGSPVGNAVRLADVIVFASGADKDCVGTDVPLLQKQGKNVFYIGTKDFGDNLNWIIRLPLDERPTDTIGCQIRRSGKSAILRRTCHRTILFPCWHLS